MSPESCDLDGQIAVRPTTLTGPATSIADAALFYVFFWASKTNIEMPPRCQALFERRRARPVVHQMLREEGYR